MPDRPHIECSIGNLKVGKDTIILNITSGIDCESKRLGLCQVPDGACYAIRAEKFRPSVLPYRRRQTRIWDALTPEELAEDVAAVANRKTKIPIKYLRMQEAGDFRTQADVNKTSRLADLLKGVVKVYTYTARRDLDYSRISPNLVINGSGFMVSNNFKVVQKGTVDPKKPKCRGIKGGGCYGCKLCKDARGITIQEELRSSGGRQSGTGDEDHTGDTDEHGGVVSDVADLSVGSSGKTKTKYSAGSGGGKRTTSKRKNKNTDTGINRAL